MAAQIIDGKSIAQDLCDSLAHRVTDLQKKNIHPCLAVILVGDDPASSLYVRNKVRRCQQIGILSRKIELSATISQQSLVKTIDKLNSDSSVHGILVQLPLPDYIDKLAVINSIESSKDVDGFSYYNTGALVNKASVITPCTPNGIMQMLRIIGVELPGKHAVIIGRSSIVGRPMAHLLLAANCTVTIVHSHTQDLARLCRQADILVVAVGRPEMVQADWVKSGAVVIDVGINTIERDGKKTLVGDVNYKAVAEVAGHITPVPGGCGPMTIACLMANTISLASQAKKH